MTVVKELFTCKPTVILVQLCDVPYALLDGHNPDSQSHRCIYIYIYPVRIIPLNEACCTLDMIMVLDMTHSLLKARTLHGK